MGAFPLLAIVGLLIGLAIKAASDTTGSPKSEVEDDIKRLKGSTDRDALLAAAARARAAGYGKVADEFEARAKRAAPVSEKQRKQAASQLLDSFERGSPDAAKAIQEIGVRAAQGDAAAIDAKKKLEEEAARRDASRKKPRTDANAPIDDAGARALAVAASKVPTNDKEKAEKTIAETAILSVRERSKAGDPVAIANERKIEKAWLDLRDEMQKRGIPILESVSPAPSAPSGQPPSAAPPEQLSTNEVNALLKEANSRPRTPDGANEMLVISEKLRKGGATEYANLVDLGIDQLQKEIAAKGGAAAYAPSAPSGTSGVGYASAQDFNPGLSKFEEAMRMNAWDHVSDDYRLGAYGFGMRRLCDLGLCENPRQDTFRGRTVWIADWKKPYSLKGFLSDPEFQRSVFFADVNDRRKMVETKLGNAIGQNFAGTRATVSGLVAAATRAGESGLAKWVASPADRMKFQATTEAYRKGNGLF